MFIIDSLIGNTDRRNGNWGFISDIRKNFYIRLIEIRYNLLKNVYNELTTSKNKKFLLVFFFN